MSYKDRIKMKFNVAQLDNIIVALLNNAFNKKFAGNVKRLFSLFSADSFKSDYEKEYRVHLINLIVDIITKNSIGTKESLLNFLEFDGKYYNDCTELLNNLYDAEICEAEMSMLDSLISNQLRYSAIIEGSSALSDMLIDLQNENYENLEDALAKLENKMDTMSSDMKSARESLEDAKKDLNLASSGFVTFLDGVIKKERNPATKIKTGIQYMNTMLNGGFEKGRVYCALGVAKGWKSGFMLNSASWAKRFNECKTHDPNLKPVIVYLSMENTNEETVTRLWNHCFGNNSEMKLYEPADAARMLESAKIFTPNDPNSPELLIWYRANRSINTADLNVMLEDLKKQGKECVFLILDYLKRIRPVEQSKELRIELSNITNELKTIAMEQDIPILSAMQLNREAFKSLEDADTFEEKVRASDKLGASNIGESIDIIQNVDYAFIVNKMQKRILNEAGEPEYSDRFLFVKLIACRAKQPPIISFKHRFKDDNDMCLIEDINLARPISTNTDAEYIKSATQDGQKTKGGRRIVG